MRFERGTDPRLPVTAMERACALLEEIGAGTARGTVVDRHPRASEPRTSRAAARPHRRAARRDDSGRRRLPHSRQPWIHDRADAPDGLGGHGAGPAGRRASRSGSHRGSRAPLRLRSHSGRTSPPLRRRRRRSIRASPARAQLRSVMTGAGFSEAVTFGFVAAAAAAPFAADGDSCRSPIRCPRTSPCCGRRRCPGLVDAVAHNRRREQRDVRLFEIGARFSRTRGERRAIAAPGPAPPAGDHWSGGTRDVDFFDMKGRGGADCDALGIDVRAEPHRRAVARAGRAAASSR